MKTEQQEPIRSKLSKIELSVTRSKELGKGGLPEWVIYKETWTELIPGETKPRTQSRSWAVYPRQEPTDSFDY